MSLVWAVPMSMQAFCPSLSSPLVKPSIQFHISWGASALMWLSRSPSSWGGGGNLQTAQGNGVFFGAFFHLLPFLCSHSRGKAGAPQFDGSISAPPDRHYLQVPVVKMQQFTCCILCNRTPAICHDFTEKNYEVVSGRALEVEIVHAG